MLLQGPDIPAKDFDMTQSHGHHYPTDMIVCHYVYFAQRQYTG